MFGPQDSPPADCTTGGIPVGTAVTVSDGTTTYHPSAGFTPGTAGTYWWYASYGGDDQNVVSNSLCGAGMASTAVAAAAPPVTTISLTPGSPNGSNGWYTRPVTAGVSATSTATDIRCELDPATVPASFADLPDSCAYTGAGAAVASDGQHVLYAAAADSSSNAGAVVSASFQIDGTAPTLSPSVSPNPVQLNGTATASPNATDPSPGSGLFSSSCPAAPTFPAGVHTITCTATDNAGNSKTAQLSYVVQYALTGFQSPYPNTKWKTGSTVPVKLQLTDATGTPIPGAEASALAASCRVAFSATGAQPLTHACLKYNATSHQFSFNWKLAKAPTGIDTITVTVTYPGTTTTTTRSETITITS